MCSLLHKSDSPLTLIIQPHFYLKLSRYQNGSLKSLPLITNFNPRTEETILQLIKNKDRKVFDLIYDYYGSALFGVVTRQLQEKTVTEDAFVKIFVKIWKQIDDYKPEESRLFTWMYDIALHEIKHFPKPHQEKTMHSS